VFHTSTHVYISCYAPYRIGRRVNQQESIERAAVQVAMQERENEIARVSRMKKSTPNVAGQAANGTGTGSTEIVTDVDLQLFRRKKRVGPV